MALTPQLMPTSGVVGIPTGLKEAGKRVDFKPDDFDLMIETKGYRVAWSRAAQCPCASLNDQTDQPNPLCELCEGSGWFYFAPSEPVLSSLVGTLTSVQEAILAKNNAAIIRGVMMGSTQDQMPFDKVTRWVNGEMMLTVRSPNKLGYYDKVVNLDSEVVFSELRKTDGSGKLPLRYLTTGVNLVRSEDVVYVQNIDYDAIDGEVVWKTGKEPVAGTPVVCHYLMHPTWLVTQHPHVLRTTPVKFKKANPTTPQGDPRALPIQALIKLDFLP